MIMMDGEEINNLANHLKEKLDDLYNYIKQLNSVNENIKASWIGDDARKYTSAMQRNISDLIMLCNMLDDYVKYAKKAASAYAALDEVYTSKGIGD